MAALAEVLLQIKEWMANHAPASLENLNAPASLREIAKLRFLLPAETPAELYELLEVHDGEGWQRLESLLPDFSLMPSSEVVRVYGNILQREEETMEFAAAEVATGQRRVHGPVLAICNSPRRIPFATMDGKIDLLIDLMPAPGGHHGQVISEDVEDGRWEVLAPSLLELFDSYLQALKSGQLDIDTDGCVCNDRGLWPGPTAIP